MYKQYNHVIHSEVIFYLPFVKGSIVCAEPIRREEVQAILSGADQTHDKIHKQHIESQRSNNTQHHQPMNEAASTDSNDAATTKLQYVVDLDAAEEAERKLASGEGLQGAEKEAEAPQDPVDSLRSVMSHKLPLALSKFEHLFLFLHYQRGLKSNICQAMVAFVAN